MAKKVLKVNLRHPHRRYRLGKHMIVQHFAEYDLSKEEEKELKDKGPQKWIIIGKKSDLPTSKFSKQKEKEIEEEYYTEEEEA